jgi:hypothetical protein
MLMMMQNDAVMYDNYDLVGIQTMLNKFYT